MGTPLTTFGPKRDQYGSVHAHEKQESSHLPGPSNRLFGDHNRWFLGTCCRQEAPSNGAGPLLCSFFHCLLFPKEHADKIMNSERKALRLSRFAGEVIEIADPTSILCVRGPGWKPHTTIDYNWISSKDTFRSKEALVARTLGVPKCEWINICINLMSQPFRSMQKLQGMYTVQLLAP